MIDEDKDNNKRPFVVTFYSFKGGVGRSTSLAFVANVLTSRGHRVVMIDFDLEAPGLSFTHSVEIPGAATYGVLDYIYQRYLTPDQNEPKIEACIQQISTSTRGELYLIPAGEYNEGYIHRLADLNVRSLYQSDTNLIHQLLADVKSTLDPDIILIDARTGFTEMGAVALFDQADLGVICFSPTSQSFAGLEWVVKASSKQRKYYGVPDLRFLLTPMPPVAQTQQQEWLATTADWITQHWGVPSSMTVDDLYYPVPYNPSIITLDSLFAEVPTAILDSYVPVADAISASVPEKNTTPLISSDIKILDNHSSILNELKFRSPTAQEMDAREIPTIFQRTGDFPKFLQDRTWLVRGAKGTGKTLLFRLFIEQSENARKFAEPYEKIHNVQFIPGHGPINLRGTLLTSGSLEDHEKFVGQHKWEEEDLWRLVLRQALHTSPKLATLIQQETAIEVSRLDSILQLDVLRRGLFPLWGERMGRGNKSFTYNWVRKRIGDYKENRFPRSLILLLERAVENEKAAYDRNTYTAILRPRSLIDALQVVSQERVNDVFNEYSEFVVYLKKLDTERSPIDRERLETIWEVGSAKLKELVTGMTAAGILQEYTSRPLIPDSGARYSVAELYLPGLGMIRLGQR